MAKYVMHRGKEIPKVTLPDGLLAERRLQLVHGYFQWWREVLGEEFGDEKLKELIVKWGKQQGIHTARLYEAYLKRKGVNLNDLSEILYETARSSEITGEVYKAWVEGKKGVVQTLICPTGKMFVELGLGPECCVNQCDCWMEEAWRAVPTVDFKRTKGIDKDDFCEWEIWLKE